MPTEISINANKFIEDLPHLYSESSYWLIRANKGKYFTDFSMNNYVGISFNEISLQSLQNTGGLVEEIKQIVMNTYPQTNPSNYDDATPGQTELFPIEDGDELEDDSTDMSKKKNPGSIAGQLSRFAFNIRQNDIVVVPNKNSEMLLVGQVCGNPYEVSEQQLGEMQVAAKESDYVPSDFQKRINVKWLGRFNRYDADAKLYPMIYAQHTVSQIDDYSPYINRALFDAYIIDDEELHLTYHITQESNVDARPLGQFIYQYSMLFDIVDAIIQGKKEIDYDIPGLVVKVNVQSKGPAEIVSKNTLALAFTFLILSSVIAGGHINISIASQTISYNSRGIVKAIDDHEDSKAKREIEIDNARKESESSTAFDKSADITAKTVEAYRLAKKLNVPVSSLGIDLPQKAEQAIQKQINTENAKKSASHNDENQTKDDQ